MTPALTNALAALASRLTSSGDYEAVDVIDTASARIARLEEALRPFVEWHRIRETQGGVTGAPHHSDDTPIFMAASVVGEQFITLGDLRRARAALGSDAE